MTMPIDDIDNATDTPSTWPPPVYAEDHVEPANTSGTNTTVPPEITSLHWDWGAFILAPLWTIANKHRGYAFVFWAILLLQLSMASQFISLLLDRFPVFQYILMLGAVDVVLRCTLATSGHRIAWRNRRFPGGLEQFRKVQKAWFRWGVATSICVAIFTARTTYYLIMGLHAMMNAFAHLGAPN